MDVGATVGNTAIFTAIFAFMSCIALWVELGDNPKEDDKSNGRASAGGLFRKKKSAESPDQIDRTIDSTHAALTDGLARSEINETTSGSSLRSLRARFIDGFLGPRIKYDVALTTLYESQNKTVETPDEGSDMATQAFLEATQSIIFSED